MAILTCALWNGAWVALAPMPLLVLCLAPALAEHGTPRPPAALVLLCWPKQARANIEWNVTGSSIGRGIPIRLGQTASCRLGRRMRISVTIGMRQPIAGQPCGAEPPLWLNLSADKRSVLREVLFQTCDDDVLESVTVTEEAVRLCWPEHFGARGGRRCEMKALQTRHL